MNLVLVTGSRNWKTYKIIYDRLAKEPYDTVVIEGGCGGADRMAKRAAMALKFVSITMDANWERFSNSAGPRRNRDMVHIFSTLQAATKKAIAFPTAGSIGTLDCIQVLKDNGFKAEIITEP